MKAIGILLLILPTACVGSSVHVPTRPIPLVELKVSPLKTGQTGTMTVSSGDTKIVAKDVLAGEVWLCSGQSKMEMKVAHCNKPREETATAMKGKPLGLSALAVDCGKNEIVLKGRAGVKIVAVNSPWADKPTAPLHHSAGIPAVPFNTEAQK